MVGPEVEPVAFTGIAVAAQVKIPCGAASATGTLELIVTVVEAVLVQPLAVLVTNSV
jgi:hypothetical protein